MDRAELAQHGAHLVGLQPADEVPIQRRKISQGLLLGDGLLQPTLGKTALTQARQGANGLRRMPLAHRQQACGGRELGLQDLVPLRQERSSGGSELRQGVR